MKVFVDECIDWRLARDILGHEIRSILTAMKIATGKVVDGKIVLEGAAFDEGTSVTVLAREVEDGVALTPEEEAELLLAIAEADRGEMVSAEVVLAKLASRHG